MIRSFH